MKRAKKRGWDVIRERRVTEVWCSVGYYKRRERFPLLPMEIGQIERIRFIEIPR